HGRCWTAADRSGDEARAAGGGQSRPRRRARASRTPVVAPKVRWPTTPRRWLSTGEALGGGGKTSLWAGSSTSRKPAVPLARPAVTGGTPFRVSAAATTP